MRSPWLNDRFTSSRRRFLTGAALLAAGASVGATGSCSTTPGSVDPAVIDQINQEIGAVCNATVIVAAATIAAIILAKFPEFAVLSSLTPDAAKQIAEFVCSLIPPVKQGERLVATSPVNVEGVQVPIHGWQFINGKPVWF